MDLTGGQIVVQTLINEGVPYIIGIPGHGTLGLSDALLRQDKLRVLQVRHEQAAVHLADGYYRIAGSPLAVYTSIGPGAMNTVIGVASCYVDSIPVLVVTGNSHTHMAGRGVLQEIERGQMPTAWLSLSPSPSASGGPPARATTQRHAARLCRDAHRAARPSRHRPAYGCPVRQHRRGMGAALPARLSPQRPGAARPCSSSGGRTAGGCPRPVIVAGGGVIAAGAWDELRELAEFLGAPVVTTMMGKGAFPEDHPWPVSRRLQGNHLRQRPHRQRRRAAGGGHALCRRKHLVVPAGHHLCHPTHPSSTWTWTPPRLARTIPSRLASSPTPGPAWRRCSTG